MNILKESNTKKIDKNRRKYEFLSQLREEEDEHEEFIDEVSAIRQATREKVGQCVMLPTPYEVSDVYLESEYQRVRNWIYALKIGKKPSVAKVLDEAKKVTCFIYNHIWTVDLMKKYTQGKQILRPALTRFATHFIQLEEITRQKSGLGEMFNSKSGNGPDGGGLSPIDENDGYSGDRGEIRSSS
ncbi:hypothetical protein PVK06_046959 [Gossypium arboreum]|uniref:Uncharacterized protein n=1 Tax=Gossypium arboreum TaxID=29729 RepID=A0ABR0MC25_GOSAR|nr:hypothetical protein PVK06_046959 [Gossypium arboreum]